MATLINIHLSVETLRNEYTQLKEEITKTATVLKKGHEGVRMWS